MKLIIAGSRSITNRTAVSKAIGHSPWKVPPDDGPLHAENEISDILHGDADGVDQSAKEIAQNAGSVTERQYPADKIHPLKRNRHMAEDSDALLAVWDGESSGTRHMIDQALDQGLETYVYVVKS